MREKFQVMTNVDINRVEKFWNENPLFTGEVEFDEKDLKNSLMLMIKHIFKMFSPA